jgi:hypothetical protein
MRVFKSEDIPLRVEIYSKSREYPWPPAGVFHLFPHRAFLRVANVADLIEDGEAWVEPLDVFGLGVEVLEDRGRGIKMVVGANIIQPSGGSVGNVGAFQYAYVNILNYRFPVLGWVIPSLYVYPYYKGDGGWCILRYDGNGGGIGFAFAGSVYRNVGWIPTVVVYLGDYKLVFKQGSVICETPSGAVPISGIRLNFQPGVVQFLLWRINAGYLWVSSEVSGGWVCLGEVGRLFNEVKVEMYDLAGFVIPFGLVGGSARIHLPFIVIEDFKQQFSYTIKAKMSSSDVYPKGVFIDEKNVREMISLGDKQCSFIVFINPNGKLEATVNIAGLNRGVHWVEYGLVPIVSGQSDSAIYTPFAIESVDINDSGDISYADISFIVSQSEFEWMQNKLDAPLDFWVYNPVKIFNRNNTVLFSGFIEGIELEDYLTENWKRVRLRCIDRSIMLRTELGENYGTLDGENVEYGIVNSLAKNRVVVRGSMYFTNPVMSSYMLGDDDLLIAPDWVKDEVFEAGVFYPKYKMDGNLLEALNRALRTKGASFFVSRSGAYVVCDEDNYAITFTDDDILSEGVSIGGERVPSRVEIVGVDESGVPFVVWKEHPTLSLWLNPFMIRRWVDTKVINIKRGDEGEADVLIKSLLRDRGFKSGVELKLVPCNRVIEYGIGKGVLVSYKGMIWICEDVTMDLRSREQVSSIVVKLRLKQP